MGSSVLYGNALKFSSVGLIGGLLKSNPTSTNVVKDVLYTPYLISSRTTFVLKRVKALPKVFPNQRKIVKLKAAQYIYDVIEDHATCYEKQKDIKIILVKYVEGLGKAGDVVEVNPNFAYNNLLLPKFGIYATPENLANVGLYRKSAAEDEYSSKTSKTLMRVLPFTTIPVVMNKESEWTIEPWHIKASARKIGVHILNESSIHIPGPSIKGSDLELHGKDFLVILTVNNKEKIKMRCKILLWATRPAERYPIENQFWCFRGEPVHPEEAEELNILPIHKFNPDKVDIPSQI